MTNDELRDENASQGNDSDVNKEMAATLKKLQSEMESLKSQNEALQKELMTAKSKTKTASKKSAPSAVRKLFTDDGDQQKTREERLIIINDEGGDDTISESNTKKQHDQQHNIDKEKRKFKHRKSRSHGHVPESVKKELQEFRELIERISGVPKYLENATSTTSTSYADSPFTDLVYAFNLQFATSRVFEKTTTDLYKIVQRYREPLRDYLTRFNREKMAITNCDVPMAIGAFRRGLERDSPLYDELTKYPCRTMDDVQAKVLAQVRLEEDKRKADRQILSPKSEDTNI
ncbi:hypothetical protein AgCh_001876 [Apium graveolens]